MHDLGGWNDLSPITLPLMIFRSRMMDIQHCGTQFVTFVQVQSWSHHLGYRRKRNVGEGEATLNSTSYIH